MIEQLRELGLSMAMIYPPVTREVEGEGGVTVEVTTQRFVCWTTDKAKAEAAEGLGATLRTYTSKDPSCNGWEVNANVVVGE